MPNGAGILLIVLCTGSFAWAVSGRTLVYSITATSAEQVALLEQVALTLQSHGKSTSLVDEVTGRRVQFWDDQVPLGTTVKVSVPVQLQVRFLEFCVQHKLAAKLEWDDLLKTLEESSPKVKENPSPQKLPHALEWTSYHRYTTIEAYFRYLASTHPESVKLENLGKTYEGRALWILQIGRNPNSSKPAIWIDSGIHAREWISSATITYMVNEMMTKDVNSWMLDELVWYFLPVVNPDGFDFTHTNERLWRRTRRLNPFGECIGVDANRNYDFYWQKEKPVTDPCSNTFGGWAPYSEPENLYIFDKVLDLQHELKAFMTFHSYGQYWMTPYGYTHDVTDDYPDLYSLAVNATEALKKVHGTTYRVGTSAAVLYTSSGTSRDFAKGRTPIKYVYTVELRDRGQYEFILPANQIIPTGEETFEALKVVAAQISKEFG